MLTQTGWHACNADSVCPHDMRGRCGVGAQSYCCPVLCYTQHAKCYLSSTFGGSGSLAAVVLKSKGAKRATAPSPVPEDCTEVEVVCGAGCMRGRLGERESVETD